MEILILLLIVLVYCLILNVNIYYILTGLFLLMGVVVALFTIAFAYCGICLLFAKKKEAVFVEIAPVKNSKFQVAYYKVEGQVYPCIFPREGILEDKLYRTDKVCYVRVHKRMGKVYDRYAQMTCWLGLAFGACLMVGIVLLF